MREPKLDASQLVYPLFIIDGLNVKDEIKSLFNVETVAWMFIIGGLIFLVVEYFYTEKEFKEKLK